MKLANQLPSCFESLSDPLQDLKMQQFNRYLFEKNYIQDKNCTFWLYINETSDILHAIKG